MRRIILSIIAVISVCGTLHAQQYGSQVVNAGIDQYVCALGNSLTLKPTFLQGTDSFYAKKTTAYTLKSIPFNSVTWYNTGGLVQTFSNDEDTNRLILPFAFCFYGATYAAGSTVYLNSNGFLTFNNVSPTLSDNVTSATVNLTANFTSAPLVNAGPTNNFNNAIYGNWEDLDPTAAGSPTGTVRVQTIGTAPHRMFVVNFDNIKMWGATCGPTGFHSFQMVLYETSNVIEIYTKEKGGCGASAVAGRGISGILGKNGDGAGVPITGRNNQLYTVSTVNSDAYRFIPSGANGTLFQWYNTTTNSVVSTNPYVTVTPTLLPTKYVARLFDTLCNGTILTFTDTMDVKVSNLTVTTSQIQTNCNKDTNGIILINNHANANPVTNMSWSPNPAGSSYVLTPSNSVSDTIKGLWGAVTPGTAYTVTVTTLGGCTKTFVVNVIQPPPYTFVSPTGSTIEIPCTDTAACSTFLATGQNGAPVAYTISSSTPTVTGNLICGMKLGTYTIIATDYKGCTGSKVVNVTNPPPISIVLDSTKNITCSQQGMIAVRRIGGSTIFPGGGIPYYTYTISPNIGLPAVTPSLTSPNPFAKWTNVPKGTYTVIVTDSKGCSSSTLVTIDSSAAPVFNTPLITGIPCNPSACIGSFNSQATSYSSSVFSYTYSYTTPGASPLTNNSGIFNNLCAGLYTTTVTDNRGCTKTYVFNIAQPTPIVITHHKTDVFCNGAFTGKDSLEITGGAGTYTLSINPSRPLSGNVFSGLNAGTYTVFVGSNGICADSSVITIVNLNPVFTFGSVAIPAPCAGGTGCIKMNITGGAGFTNNNINGSTYTGLVGDTICGLTIGSVYTIAGTDAAGCSTSETITIAPTPSVSFTATHTNSYCNSANGSCNGTITITASGGTGSGYIYSNSDCSGTFVGSNLFTGLCANTYSICVKDGNGCPAASQNVIITQPLPISFSTIVDEVKCYGDSNGKIQITSVLNTSGVKYYSFDNGATFVASNINSTLPKGIYTLFVKDSSAGNACISAPISVFVDQPDTITLNASIPTPIPCYGDSGVIKATAFGGHGTIKFSLVIGGPFTTIDTFKLPQGTYTIYAKDDNLCTNSVSITLVEPSQLSIIFGPISPTGCGTQSNTGSTAVLGNNGSPFSGGLYTWTINPTTGGANISSGQINPASLLNLAASNYTITMHDANGCSITSTIAIPSPIAPIIVLTDPAPVCQPTTIDITSAAIHTTNTGITNKYYSTAALANAGGASDILNPTNIPSSGTYWVRTELANGCFAVDDVIVTINLLPTVNAVSSQTVCAGASISAINFSGNAVAGVVYNWTGTNST
ncbi:MAG: hypothetical protein RLZZ118_714, partial [Bacteroidota bacterium]